MKSPIIDQALDREIMYECKATQYTFNKYICQNNKTFNISKILIN